MIEGLILETNKNNGILSDISYAVSGYRPPFENDITGGVIISVSAEVLFDDDED